MGDEEEGPAAAWPAAVEVGGQPLDPLDVQVVGRFVQHEDVELFGQEGGQGDTPPLTSAECSDGSVPVQSAGQAGHDVADAGVAGPFVFGALSDDGRADRGGLVEAVGLGEQPDPHASAHGDAPRVGFTVARQ